MEIFTLTLTLSLKGEGIAELRKSYQDSQDYKDEQDWEAINEILQSHKSQFRHSLLRYNVAYTPTQGAWRWSTPRSA